MSSESWPDPQIAAIRNQLRHMVGCELFRQATQQIRFLEYIVEEELAGRGRKINQYTIALDVFERDESFDPLVDSIVRVEARRLRSKLTEYYADIGKHDPTIIKLPKGRYRIAVEFRRSDDRPQIKLDSDHPSQPASPSINLVPHLIAVLPFDNLSNDPNQEYFSDGIAEDVMTDLARVSGIHVISRHSSFVYKGKSVNCRMALN